MRGDRRVNGEGRSHRRVPYALLLIYIDLFCLADRRGHAEGSDVPTVDANANARRRAYRPERRQHFLGSGRSLRSSRGRSAVAGRVELVRHKVARRGVAGRVGMPMRDAGGSC